MNVDLVNYDVLQMYNKYVCPAYCWAKMYAGHIACCPLINHYEYANRTDRLMDARPSHYAYCYGCGQHNKC